LVLFLSLGVPVLSGDLLPPFRPDFGVRRLLLLILLGLLAVALGLFEGILIVGRSLRLFLVRWRSGGEGELDCSSEVEVGDGWPELSGGEEELDCSSDVDVGDVWPELSD